MRRIVLLLALALLAAGCTSAPEGTTLRVLAGSELADMVPILEEAARATGVRVQLDQVGTLDGAEQVTSGAAAATHDAVWFSSNRYLALQPGAQARIGTATEIMSSPVVLGLRRSVAQRLGWVGRPVTWAEIAAAAGRTEFTYGMTDPSASNSGFSTVVAVSTALAGTGAALTTAQAASTAPALRDYFSAQVLSAGSSGWLQDAFVRRTTGADPGPHVDGLMNYESVLVALNASGRLPEPLEIISPADGVVTAEYPFTVLAGASEQVRDAVRRLTDHLRTPDVQRAIAERTSRRPAVPGVPQTLGPAPVELPFPARAEVVDTLLTSWFDKVRRPSRTIYVLDVSGSMGEQDRIGRLRASLTGLTGGDPGSASRYRRFRGREEVTLLPFSDRPGTPDTVTVPQDDPSPGLTRIAADAAGLRPGGQTAIYDALDSAYAVAARQITADPDRFTSIVLMTDGANNTGRDLADFTAGQGARAPALKAVPIFPILFADSDTGEMEQLATLTGGRTFDARRLPLDQVFQEIRGYV
ncbi:VWA domain-containing protein [Pseudonocardia ailaonensis]|uniref:VWA domain-containing protein n=1 Tax=Pseudonocardia ailaonensis TaxID=367279 RepID=UPI0031D5C265